MNRSGDDEFVAYVRSYAPGLTDLARATVQAIRSAGVPGELVEATGRRWVNRPVNSFTLKPQPRVRNLQFTLYGEPRSYNEGDFLLNDQNSYSRGWVRTKEDGERLARLALKAHRRRT